MRGVGGVIIINYGHFSDLGVVIAPSHRYVVFFRVGPIANTTIHGLGEGATAMPDSYALSDRCERRRLHVDRRAFTARPDTYYETNDAFLSSGTSPSVSSLCCDTDVGRCICAFSTQNVSVSSGTYHRAAPWQPPRSKSKCDFDQHFCSPLVRRHRQRCRDVF